MQGTYEHVVQLRLTHEEWRLVSRMAALRGVSVEELLREGLRLTSPDDALEQFGRFTTAPPASRSRHPALR